MMRSRYEVLNDIINFNGKVSDLQNELSHYEWDSAVPIIKISYINIKSALLLFVNDKISLDDLTAWANILECREDIEFEDEEIEEMIFYLANPEINGNLTKEAAKEFIQNNISTS